MNSFGVILLSVLLYPCCYSLAQNGVEIMPKGARSVGLGNAHATLADPWAIFYNIGGLAQVKESQVFAGYDHRLGLNELTTLAAGGVLVASSGVFGFGISSYGGHLFNQQIAGIGYSNRLGITSLGLKVSYIQTNIEGYGRNATPLMELGGVAELTPQLFFGAHIFNISRARLSRVTEEYLPTVIKAGLSYRPSEYISINLEAEKEVYLDPQFKAGIEYSVQHKLVARTGINTHPNQLFFGIGLRPKRYRIDYALSQHYQLGFTHHFSFNYLWNKP